MPVAAQPRDRLEVGGEHEGELGARELGDLRVDAALGLARTPAGGSVAVVDGNAGNSRRLADPYEQGNVRLAAAVDDSHGIAIGVVAERLEDERERELLGASLHEQHRARQE